MGGADREVVVACWEPSALASDTYQAVESPASADTSGVGVEAWAADVGSVLRILRADLLKKNGY